jgi:hypothetical protein
VVRALPRAALGLTALDLALTFSSCRGNSSGTRSASPSASPTINLAGTLLVSSTRGDDKTGHILSKDLQSGKVTDLTPGDVTYGNPKAPPKGRADKIVVWAGPEKGPKYIATIDLVTRGINRVTRPGGPNYWDPMIDYDNRLIAKQAGPDGRYGDLVIIDPDGGTSPLATVSNQGQELYAPSPFTQTHLLATLRSNEDKNTDRIVAVSTVDGTITQHGDPSRQAWYPAYDPSSRRIAYTSNDAIWTMREDGTGGHQVSPEVGTTRNFDDPVWYMGYLICVSQTVDNGNGGPYDTVLLTPTGFQVLDRSPTKSDDLGPLVLPNR